MRSVPHAQHSGHTKLCHGIGRLPLYLIKIFPIVKPENPLILSPFHFLSFDVLGRFKPSKDRTAFKQEQHVILDPPASSLPEHLKER
jgi:hypothetical protein